MKVTIGTAGLDYTQQASFPETITDPHVRRGADSDQDICEGMSRIAFVAHEEFDRSKDAEDQEFVCNLHPNEYHDGSAWLHDLCSVAVYFCQECLESVTRWNQG